MLYALKNSFFENLPASLFTAQPPIPVAKPEMVIFNGELAKELGVEETFADESKAAVILAGNELMEGSRPISQAYAGHQFGHFNRLGDGRAVLLGEIQTDEGLYDLQLKGSGQTPYSRRGDGRATLYSMLREYLMSEAMHALGISTTRSLSVVKTGEDVYREHIHDGGILSRVATSHIRVGTFEFARYLGGEKDSEQLLEYTIKRHYPSLVSEDNLALALLHRVMQQQSELINHWLRVGFIHGVMNTDNVSIAGETIDYGPCAFMNVYHPQTVFSSIDRNGRYAFANQPNIAFWNLKIFANALLPLIGEDEKLAVTKAEEVLGKFPQQFSKSYLKMMTDKLGIQNHMQEDASLVEDCLRLLQKHTIDYTNFFTELRKNGSLIQELREDADFNAWHIQWEKARVRLSNLEESEALMIATNPVVIPRNHLVEEALEAAVNGDMNPFHDLLKTLVDPYNETRTPQELPVGVDEGYQTFCGT
ncbi:MAG: YdiU family protein [Flavobacteriales bacterium]|nr:YdiU family protein [Flavobacteriales bacterium]